MIKKVFVVRIMLIGLFTIVLNGCTFIVKDDNLTRYYGIDQKRGNEFLNQILEMQQQVYQAEKAAAGVKNP